MKSTTEIIKSEEKINLEKTQLLEGLKDGVIVITVPLSVKLMKGEDNYANLFSAIVLNQGQSDLPIGGILTNQSKSSYSLFKGSITLEN